MYGGRTYVSSRIMCGSVRTGFIFVCVHKKKDACRKEMVKVDQLLYVG